MLIFLKDVPSTREGEKILQALQAVDTFLFSEDSSIEDYGNVLEELNINDASLRLKAVVSILWNILSVSLAIVAAGIAVLALASPVILIPLLPVVAASSLVAIAAGAEVAGCIAAVGIGVAGFFSYQRAAQNNRSLKIDILVKNIQTDGLSPSPSPSTS